MKNASQVFFTQDRLNASSTDPWTGFTATLLDEPLDFESIGDKLELGKCALLAFMDHACQSMRIRVRQDVVKVGCGGLWPNRDRSAELLQPQLTPILSQGTRQKLCMSDELEPLVHVKFEIMLESRQQIATAPSSALSMSNGVANRSS